MIFANEYAVLISILLGVGFAAGFAGGLFGVGGGIITTPVLYATFKSLGVDDGPSLKCAIGTSLAVIIVTSVRSVIAHHRAGHVDIDILRGWAPWIGVGAGVGGMLARWAPAEFLTIIFALGALFVAQRRLFSDADSVKAPLHLGRKRMKIPLGLGTGFFSSLMGIGGGAVGVMVMTLAGRTMHAAIATSADFGIAVAVPGVVGFMVSGFSAPGLPMGSLGFVNGPTFVTLAIMAGIAAPLGARAAHQLDGDLLSKIFGVYVLLAAGTLTWDVFTG